MGLNYRSRDKVMEERGRGQTDERERRNGTEGEGKSYLVKEKTKEQRQVVEVKERKSK